MGISESPREPVALTQADHDIIHRFVPAMVKPMARRLRGEDSPELQEGVRKTRQRLGTEYAEALARRAPEEQRDFAYLFEGALRSAWEEEIYDAHLDSHTAASFDLAYRRLLMDCSVGVQQRADEHTKQAATPTGEILHGVHGEAESALGEMPKRHL